MSKPKHKKRGRRQLQTLPLIPTQQGRTGIWRRIPLAAKILIGPVSVALACFGAYAVAEPRLSIQPSSEAVDSSNPYVTPFTLTNDGYFSIYQVKATCIPHILKFKAINSRDAQAQIKNQAFTGDVLGPDEHRSFVCDVFHFTNNPQTIEYADVGIGVTFQPIRRINWRLFRQFLFQAAPQPDGKLHWSALSLQNIPESYPPNY
jgi:hypothetical protein